MPALRKKNYHDEAQSLKVEHLWNASLVTPTALSGRLRSQAEASDETFTVITWNTMPKPYQIQVLAATVLSDPDRSRSGLCAGLHSCIYVLSAAPLFGHNPTEWLLSPFTRPAVDE
ncbi:hypothetical protein PGTUg99_034318 [Puccinia graminis f. sp. tritici]|uniref:Uncharacterized protein n=1 Tax=Puccinia graminis f. sp. tritici TaxID=56615 RepID=A0A5B0MIR0_PUCGR|nr:hypothetical protein PGTUg99_036716 [Puccinia graminis f. sp. tritici]KAA1075670.1 hypothetical protein PGTUg99_034318 [Puccinia graminis f. sp. tritici]